MRYLRLENVSTCRDLGLSCADEHIFSGWGNFGHITSWIMRNEVGNWHKIYTCYLLIVCWVLLQMMAWEGRWQEGCSVILDTETSPAQNMTPAGAHTSHTFEGDLFRLALPSILVLVGEHTNYKYCWGKLMLRPGELKKLSYAICMIDSDGQLTRLYICSSSTSFN